MVLEKLDWVNKKQMEVDQATKEQVRGQDTIKLNAMIREKISDIQDLLTELGRKVKKMKKVISLGEIKDTKVFL